MAELFVVGTFWFWVLTLATIILLAILTESENGVGATICLVVYCGLLYWMGSVDIVGFLIRNPLQVVLAVASYFIIGTVWGVARWALFVKARSQDVHEAVRDYCQNNKIEFVTPISVEVWERFSRWVLDHSYEVTRQFHVKQADEILSPPRIRDHKERFIRWLSFWPVSMLSTVLNDAVRHICSQIYLTLARKLQAISDAIYKRAVPQDFPNKPKV